MLPQLSETDIFLHAPDVEGVDLLAEDYTRKQIPKGMGVYCLYHPLTLEVWYIGSGCGIDPTGRIGSGLRLRLKLYRYPKGSHDHKVHDAIKANGLLVKAWITSNQGDAHKYESDAIQRCQPVLNVVGCRILSDDEAKAKESAKSKAKRAKRVREQVYNPDLPKKCGRCKFPKLCRDFRRSAGMPLAVVGTCKKCEVEIRKAAAAFRKAEAKRLGVPYNQRHARMKLGPTQALVLRTLQHIGKGKAAAISTEIYGGHTVQHITNVCYALYALRSKGAVVSSNRVWSATTKADLLLQSAA
jgi:hypothetical protein